MFLIVYLIIKLNTLEIQFKEVKFNESTVKLNLANRTKLYTKLFNKLNSKLDLVELNISKQ